MDVGVRLLGPPAIRVAGAWAQLRPSKPNALLVYLAYRGGRVRRGELTTLLWAEADATHAQDALRQALRRLASGPFGAVLGRDRTSAWSRAESDVALFGRAIAEQRWHDAVRAHAGPLVQGFELDDADEFASWLAGERAFVNDGWRRACHAVIRHAGAAGRHDEAWRVADMLVRADALDEQAVRASMAAAAATGDVRAAVRRYETFAALLETELAVAPEAATRALLEDIKGRAAGVALADSPDVSPALVAPRVSGGRIVIGREQAIAALVDLLPREDVRLITLLGPAGVGKSTLAAALVDQLAAEFPDGVFVAPLEGAAGDDAVALAAAHAAGVEVRPGASVAMQVALALGPRRALLVLDGYEEHRDEAETVDTLVRHATLLRVLVTSRVRLRLSTEHVVEVHPLTTRAATESTEEAESATASPAAELFRRVAGRHLPAAVVRSFDRDAVERIALAVGGNPLALELAGSWVDVLGLEGLEEQLRSSWEPLRSDERDRSPRRRDLRGAIEETWQQSAPEDRTAWARLAVLPGSFEPAVAVEVAGSGWRGVRRLLDRAVLRHRGERLELHALLGRFGRERAEEQGLADEAWRSALAVWRTRIPDEIDPRSGRRVQVHPHDLEQALGAWRWALAQGDWAALADMAIGLTRALNDAMRWREVTALALEAVSRLETAGGEEGALALARLLPRTVDDDIADRSVQVRRALGLARSLGDDVALAEAHAVLASSGPDGERAANAEAARGAYERAGDRVGLARLLHEWGWWSAQFGRFDDAKALLQEAFVLYDALADAGGLADVHDSLARVALLRGDRDGALEHVRIARELSAARGIALRDVDTYATEAWATLLTDDHEAAAERIEAFTERAARIIDPARLTLALKLGYHHRFGPPDLVLAYGTRLLAALPAAEVGSALGVRTTLLVAAAHATLGAPDEALAPLAEALRVTRALRAPRFVAHVALAAASVASTLGERVTALRLASMALDHPALEHALRRDARALVSESSGAADGAPATPPDDDALLAEIEDVVTAWDATRTRSTR